MCQQRYKNKYKNWGSLYFFSNKARKAQKQKICSHSRKLMAWLENHSSTQLKQLSCILLKYLSLSQSITMFFTNWFNTDIHSFIRAISIDSLTDLLPWQALCFLFITIILPCNRLRPFPAPEGNPFSLVQLPAWHSVSLLFRRSKRTRENS